MSYIDGFVAAVPTINRAEYRSFAERSWSAFREYGALSMCECWGEDVPEGETTSFPMAVWKRKDESVVFSWIEWPDKETRDSCYRAMSRDPRFAEFTCKARPFDGRRSIFGGFEPLFFAR